MRLIVGVRTRLRRPVSCKGRNAGTHCHRWVASCSNLENSPESLYFSIHTTTGSLLSTSQNSTHFPRVPLMPLTATATPDTRKQVKEIKFNIHVHASLGPQLSFMMQMEMHVITFGSDTLTVVQLIDCPPKCHCSAQKEIAKHCALDQTLWCNSKRSPKQYIEKQIVQFFHSSAVIFIDTGSRQSPAGTIEDFSLSAILARAMESMLRDPICTSASVNKPDMFLLVQKLNLGMQMIMLLAIHI